MTPWYLLIPLLAALSATAGEPVHFSRQIRPILSENCFFCHGPDEKKREAGLRFDEEKSAKSDNDGTIAIVPGHPEKSALLQRILSTDPDEVMPPPKQHKVISREQIELLTEWIRQGAQWGNHWSYEPVTKPHLPANIDSTIKNPIDAFLRARFEKENLAFSPPAPPHALLRRLALDLTGLPPTLEEIDRFIPLIQKEYETVVNHYLAKPAYGEHWAAQWMDLARYADSSGYPSDQPREIWAWRDWVISAFNGNLPFDRFTIDQLAGDLLPKPSEDQLIATAFHRNTMTQNEGGTSDEEFRNAAIIDRVNTTMAVWMGTTIACAQCHTHKYDPITITEYYQFYDFLNQTADADKKDESPVHSFFTPELIQQKQTLEAEMTDIEKQLNNPPPAWLAGFNAWDKSFPRDLAWQTPVQSAATTNGSTVTLPLEDKQLTAVQLRFQPSSGSVVIKSIHTEIVSPAGSPPPQARFVRIEVPGKKRFLQLAEVEVISGGKNIADTGKATQSSLYADAAPARAIDGNTAGDYSKGSVAHTAEEENPWWQLDLQKASAIESIRVWNRTDGNVGSRLEGYRVVLLDDKKQPLWTLDNQPAPKVDALHSFTGPRPVVFSQAFSDAEQPGFSAASVLLPTEKASKGWASPAGSDSAHHLTFLTRAPVGFSEGSLLRVRLELNNAQTTQPPLHITYAVSSDARVRVITSTPEPVLSALRIATENRTAAQRQTLNRHYIRSIAKESASTRQRLTTLEKELAAVKPTSVPVFVELPADQRRKSHIQNRGEWQNLGAQVHAATPAALHPLPQDAPRNRLTLARWLVSKNNPLTARVTVNRYWESIFGTGIVRSSEDFGNQGDLPVHPELLDWLASDFMENGWDLKHLLKRIVTSTAYQQDSATSPALDELDPENRLLARGPRFRPSGELLRDQALATSGLLSHKIGGPPVRPMTPNLGLSTAFGRSNDWTVSEGEDKHRRSLYTEVRRNAPYASFTTFDAGNREVCMIRRNRTNTPLQAFVTLNDPVFIEAHQAMARRLLEDPALKSDADRLHFLFRLTLCRPPTTAEQAALLTALADARHHFASDAAAAVQFSTDPLGPLPKDMDPQQTAAWTTLTNIVMNLDEFLMRR